MTYLNMAYELAAAAADMNIQATKIRSSRTLPKLLGQEAGQIMFSRRYDQCNNQPYMNQEVPHQESYNPMSTPHLCLHNTDHHIKTSHWFLQCRMLSGECLCPA